MRITLSLNFDVERRQPEQEPEPYVADGPTAYAENAARWRHDELRGDMPRTQEQVFLGEDGAEGHVIGFTRSPR